MGFIDNIVDMGKGLFDSVNLVEDVVDVVDAIGDGDIMGAVGEVGDAIGKIGGLPFVGQIDDLIDIGENVVDAVKPR